MRVDVISTMVTWRLHATAASGRSAGGGSAVIVVPVPVGPAAVQDPNRDVLRDRRQDRARMQHLGAEVGELRRLAEREVRHDARDSPRRADRRSACRRRRSRSGSRGRRAPRRRSPPSSRTRRVRASSSRPATVAPTNPPSTGTRPSATRGTISRATASRVSSASGAAAVWAPSVTTARRASTQAVGTPACASAAARIRLFINSPVQTMASCALGEAARRIPVALSSARRSSSCGADFGEHVGWRTPAAAGARPLRSGGATGRRRR